MSLLEQSYCVVVRMSDIIKDCIAKCSKMAFYPAYRLVHHVQYILEVAFVGEEGLDTGGLTLEFYITQKGTFVMR